MKRAFLSLLILLGLCSTSFADIFWYRLEGGIAIKLRGTTSRAPGGAVFYIHPKFGRITLKEADVMRDDYIKLGTMEAVVTKKFNAVKSSKDPDEVFGVANECLRRGMLKLFYEGVDLTLALDPQHEGALRVKRVKEMLDSPLGDSSQEEQELEAYVQNPRMEIARSAHYILLHDTGSLPIHESRKQPRAEERLELLETVYEAFMMRFWAAGVELAIPKERMKVVLFHEHTKYLEFSTSIDPSLSSTAGFYDPKSNIAFFYDQGTHEVYKSLESLTKQYRDLAESIRRSGGKPGDAVRSAETMALLMLVEQEKEDIEVVSHEGTHQLASNTGLLPRDVMVPSWVHEGLATYFECPDEAEWAGFGSVNDTRLDWYKELFAADPEKSNIDFIVGDEIFDLARSHGARLHAYGQAWALTHYLMENHFEEFMEFYRRLGEMPPDVVLNSKLLNDVFNDVFEESARKGLNRAWHSYMSSLETTDEVLEKMANGRN